MPVDLTIRQLVDTLEKQYAAQTITRDEIAAQLIEPLFESENLNFSDNARYIVNTLGRPGHALATGSNSIQQGPEVQNALRDVLDFWAASPDVELAKKLGLTPSAPSLESMKAAQSNPDAQAQGVAELLEALRSVPTTSKTAEGFAKNLKAISDIQRELLEEAGKILPGMAPENQKVALFHVTSAFKDKANSVFWQFTGRSLDSFAPDQQGIRTEVEHEAFNAFSTRFKELISQKPELAQKWDGSLREAFSDIFSGAEKYKTDLPQEILPEQPTATARKPKGPR